MVLTGQHLVSDTEVQLYQLVLQQMDYEVQLSRYTETSSVLRSHHGNTSLNDLRGAPAGGGMLSLQGLLGGDFLSMLGRVTEKALCVISRLLKWPEKGKRGQDHVLKAPEM